MSLTSYRAAPSRDKGYKDETQAFGLRCLFVIVFRLAFPWKTRQRPTLPCLKTQYHWRWGLSRPSSGWDRVQAPRYDHLVIEGNALFLILCDTHVLK